MPLLVPSKIDLKTGMFINVLSTPTVQFDAAFDSYLLKHENGCDNHTLTLVLKIFLNRVSTFGFKVFPQLDAGNVLFWIKPWTSAEWNVFQSNFKQQALRWNDRFWLTPPAGFSNLDVKVGSRTFRPNIYCHLYVDLVIGAASAHRQIDVVNLEKRLAATQLGMKQSALNSGDFQSHEGLYDSLDTTTRTNVSVDNVGKTHRHPKYLTIVHEIGHALGLPHIGVSHNDPLCQIAVLLGGMSSVNQNSLPGLLAGGSNANACYGDYAPAASATNVMGQGTSFDATNAQPWRDRIAFHTQTKASDWKVSMKRIWPAAN